MPRPALKTWARKSFQCRGTVLIGLNRLSNLLHNKRKSHFNLLFYNKRMPFSLFFKNKNVAKITRMLINSQRDGRPVEYRWHPLFNADAAVWLTPTTRVPCSNAAKTRNPLKFAGVPQTSQQISAVSTPKFTISWGHVEEVSMFTNFFSTVDTCLCCEDTARQNCAMMPKWRYFAFCICS